MSINHLHVLLRAECITAPGPDDIKKIYNKVIELINNVGMKVFMEPKVKYMPDEGNEGLTYLAGLETSHTSGHFWDKPEVSFMKYKGATLLQMDCYTCGCMAEKEIKQLLEFIAEFGPKQVNVKLFDRSTPSMKMVAKLAYNHKKQGNYVEYVENLSIVTKKSKKKDLKAA